MSTPSDFPIAFCLSFLFLAATFRYSGKCSNHRNPRFHVGFSQTSPNPTRESVLYGVILAREDALDVASLVIEDDAVDGSLYFPPPRYYQVPHKCETKNGGRVGGIRIRNVTTYISSSSEEVEADDDDEDVHEEAEPAPEASLAVEAGPKVSVAHAHVRNAPEDPTEEGVEQAAHQGEQVGEEGDDLGDDKGEDPRRG